jgi:hypothetical protein
MYLESLLAGQILMPAELAQLQELRSLIEGQLSTFEGTPRFYYAGSYGKDTIIRSSYDLDIVMYWPHDTPYTLAGIFSAVGDSLRKNWTVVQPKTVAWRLPFDNGFHVDVVPGRAIDRGFRYANLYRTDTGQSLQTSIKVHIENVRRSGRRELIRLLKLWRFRRSVPVKSFVLELMAIEGAKGTSLTELEPQLSAALIHIRDHMRTGSVQDPANSNNDLANSMSASERTLTSTAAGAAIQANTWAEVFR